MKKLLFIAMILLDLVSMRIQASEVKPIVLLDSDLGSKLLPVRCDQAEGEELYLQQLKDMDGYPVIYKRIGHGGPTQDGHYFDKYLITSADGSVTVEIYMDMAWPGYSESQAIKGFKIETTSMPPAQPSPSLPQVSPSTSAPVSGDASQPDATLNSNTSTTSPLPTPPPPADPQTTEEKIPGFDDVPTVASKTVTNKTQSSQAQPATQKGQPQNPPPSTNDDIAGFDDIADTTIASNQSPSNQNKRFLAIVPILQPEAYQGKKAKNSGQLQPIVSQAISDVFLMMASKSPGKLLVNQNDHTIHDKTNTIKNVQTLCNSTKTDQEKIEEITLLILDPGQIDLIITGTIALDEKTGNYRINAIIISKPDQKLFKSNVWEYSPNMTQSDIQNHLKVKITEIIKKKFPLLLTPQSSSPAEVYISVTPFTNLTPQKGKEEKSLPTLLDELIIKEIKATTAKNNPLVLNDPGHAIPDTPSSKKLNLILSQANLNDTEKAEKIITELMTPADIDYIFTACLTEDVQNNIIILQPYVVNKKLGKLFSINLVFQKDELLGMDGQSKRQALNKEAADNIRAALQMLCGQSLN